MNRTGIISLKLILLLCLLFCLEVEAQSQPSRASSTEGARLVKISVFPEQVQLNGRNARLPGNDAHRVPINNVTAKRDRRAPDDRLVY